MYQVFNCRDSSSQIVASESTVKPPADHGEVAGLEYLVEGTRTIRWLCSSYIMCCLFGLNSRRTEQSERNSRQWRSRGVSKCEKLILSTRTSIPVRGRWNSARQSLSCVITHDYKLKYVSHDSSM